MVNFIKILLQFGIFKMNVLKVQLSFLILRQISGNSVQFVQFVHLKTSLILINLTLPLQHKISVNFQIFITVCFNISLM